MLVVVLMPRRSKQLKLGRVDPSKRDEEQKSLKLTTQAQNLSLNRQRFTWRKATLIKNIKKLQNVVKKLINPAWEKSTALC